MITAVNKGKNMSKIVEMRKGQISNEELKSAFKAHYDIMRRHYDMQTIKTIECATDALVATTIKNGLVFNAVHGQKASSRNVLGKMEIYKEYKTFISNIQALPQIEREFFLIKLQQKTLAYKNQMRKNLILGNFDEAKNALMLVKAGQIAFDSLKGKNQALDIVPER